MLIKGVDGQAHGVLVDHLSLCQALGPSCGDVLHVQDIQHVAAHDALELRRAGQAKNKDGRQQVDKIVFDFIQAPGSIHHLARIEPTDVDLEDDDAQEHPHQCHEETGQAQAKEPYCRQCVIAERILVRGRIDADRQRDSDHENQR